MQVRKLKKSISKPKGGLISESFSLWLKSPKYVPNHYPVHLLFRWIVFRIMIWHLFLKIWAKVEKLSEMKPHLHLAIIYYLYIFNSRNFFPYILILSCIFLLATFIIYTVVPNLLNKYTRLRRHYVITIMIAFIIIAINNFVGTQEIHPIFCKLFGKYSFLIYQKKKYFIT